MENSSNTFLFHALRGASLEGVQGWPPSMVSDLVSAIRTRFIQEPNWVSSDPDLALRAIHFMSVQDPEKKLLARIKTAAVEAGLIDNKAKVLIDTCFEDNDFVPLWGLLDAGFDINTCFQDRLGVLEMALLLERYEVAERLIRRGARFQSQDDEHVFERSRQFFFHRLRRLDSKAAELFVDLALKQGLAVNHPDKWGRFFLTDAFVFCKNQTGVWSKLLEAMDKEDLKAAGDCSVELLRAFAKTAADTEDNLNFLNRLLDKIPRGIEVWEDVEGILPGARRAHDRIYSRVREWLKTYHTDKARRWGMLVSLGGYETEAKALLDHFKREGSWKDTFLQLILDPERGLGIARKIERNLEAFREDLEGIIDIDDEQRGLLDDEVLWRLVPLMTPDSLQKLVVNQSMDEIQLENWGDRSLIDLDNMYCNLVNPEEIKLYEEDLKRLSPQTVAQGVMNGCHSLFITAFDVLTEPQQRVVLAGLDPEAASVFLKSYWDSNLSLEPFRYALKATQIHFLRKALENSFFMDVAALNHEVLERAGRIPALCLRQDRPYTRRAQNLAEAFLTQYHKVVFIKQKLQKWQRLGEQEKSRLDAMDPLFLCLEALSNKIDEALRLCDNWELMKRKVDRMRGNLSLVEESTLECPISLQPISTPARISLDGEAGWHYERRSLLDYLDSHGGTALSPQTRAPFSLEHVVSTGRKRRKIEK